MKDVSQFIQYGTMPHMYVEHSKRLDAFTMTSDHYHDYYELYYMMSGSRVYFIEDRTYLVQPGDLVFVAKHVLHKTIQTGDAGHERLLFHFDEDQATKLGGERLKDLLLSPFYQASHVIRLPYELDRMIQQLIRRLLKEINEQPPGFELVPELVLKELLLLVARHVQKQPPEPLYHTTPLHAKISEIVRFINTHYDQPLQLNSLGEAFFISPYYLSRTFKQVTGFTFSDYLILVRIKEAQRLLRDTDYSITEVAALAGFENFSHFSKTFKRTVHLSPRAYRKEQTQRG